jgi:hypothetical protein
MQLTTVLGGTFRQRCPAGQPMSVYICADIHTFIGHTPNVYKGTRTKEKQD